MKSDFLIALTQLAAERHLPRETVLEAIEVALASAFKKEGIAAGQNISVKLDPASGDVKLFAVKTVVEKVEDPLNEISLAEAKRVKKGAVLGDTVAIDMKPQISSRIAAQTAKQVVLQRLRDAERELVYQEFVERVGELVPGVIENMDFGRIEVNLGRAQAILPKSGQVASERYRKGQRLQFYVEAVERTPKGPEIIVSRSHPNLLKRLFEREVPEVSNGIVEIRAVAREAGSRSKVAVAARQDGVDPVGSCIGMRGNRIQNIVNELQGEKIDVVRWNKDVATFIAKALSPAEVSYVELDKKERTAIVVVPDKHLSLAIGRDGQNARLAAKLTGWRLDIKNAVEWEQLVQQRQAEEEARRIAEREAVLEAERIAREEAGKAGAVTAEPEEAKVTSAEEQVLALEEEVKVPEVVVQEPVAEVAEEKKEKEPVAAMSAEEEVASLALEAEEEVEEEEWEEEEPLEIQTDEIWKVPAGIPDAGVIRFAEDILGQEDERRGGGKGRRERDRGGGKGGSASRGRRGRGGRR